MRSFHQAQNAKAVNVFVSLHHGFSARFRAPGPADRKANRHGQAGALGRASDGKSMLRILEGLLDLGWVSRMLVVPSRSCLFQGLSKCRRKCPAIILKLSGCEVDD